jgi:hypothetical protein
VPEGTADRTLTTALLLIDELGFDPTTVGVLPVWPGRYHDATNSYRLRDLEDALKPPPS